MNMVVCMYTVDIQSGEAFAVPVFRFLFWQRDCTTPGSPSEYLIPNSPVITVLSLCVYERKRQTEGKGAWWRKREGEGKKKEKQKLFRSSLLRGNGISLALTFAAKGFNDGMQSHAGCCAVGAVCTSVRWWICMCHEGWGLIAPPPMQMQDGLNVVLRIMIFSPFTENNWEKKGKRKRKEKLKKQTLGGDISA